MKRSRNILLIQAGHPGRDTVLRFVIGTLEAEECAAFESHVAGCAACSRALAVEAAQEQSLWSSWLAIADGTDAKPLAPVIPLTLSLSPGSSRAAGAAVSAAMSSVAAAATASASVTATTPPRAADAVAAKTARDHAVVVRRGFAAGWASGVAAAALIGIFAGRGGLYYERGTIRGADDGPSRWTEEIAMCGDAVAGEPLCRSPRAPLGMVSLGPEQDEAAVCTTATGGGQARSCESPVSVLASREVSSSATVDSFAASFMSAFPAAPMSRAE